MPMRIYVRTTPRSRENRIEKLNEAEYKVKLMAPPVDGKANEVLIGMLADHFKVARRDVRIVGGKSARTKMVDVNVRMPDKPINPTDYSRFRRI